MQAQDPRTPLKASSLVVLSHAMCASRAEYCVELHSSEKGGIYNTKWTPYCATQKKNFPVCRCFEYRGEQVGGRKDEYTDADIDGIREEWSSFVAN
ncbi:hypothetical protein L1987_57901 [Smallanthus sonchifolius]|uniref:Uncharacterized protein n=1 Tax=Smallanthus sonchifolius TaxID=185202 RepID=A0ACB9DEA2_9ASTR|nr:hypothetical protein L1987_57901 [Smallanthus sonchifolius]